MPGVILMRTKKDKEVDWIFKTLLKIEEICRKNRWVFWNYFSREKEFENLPEYVSLPSRPGEMMANFIRKKWPHDEGRSAN